MLPKFTKKILCEGYLVKIYIKQLYRKIKEHIKNQMLSFRSTYSQNQLCTLSIYTALNLTHWYEKVSLQIGNVDFSLPNLLMYESMCVIILRPHK